MASVLLPEGLPFFSGIILSISIARFFRSKKSLPSSYDPLVLDRSVSEETARTYRDEIRILEVRIESLKSLVERLENSYERGVITDDEFNSLSKKHAEEIRQLSHHLVGRRLVVELFELEEIRERIASAFSKKISELNETILTVRRKLGFDRVLSQQTFEVSILKSDVVPVPSSSASTTETKTPYPHVRVPTPKVKEPITEIMKNDEQITQPPKKLVTDKPKEEGVEDELSRIRADVESLLQELEQMEKNRE